MGFAMYGMAVVLAPAIGPTLGGYITDNYSWHWIFFINVPFGLLSLYLSNRMVEDPPWITDSIERAKHTPVDYMGLGLIAVGLGALQVVLDKGQRDDWLASHFIQLFTAAAVIGLVAFIVWEMREANPVLNLRLLKNRNLAVSNLLMFTLGCRALRHHRAHSAVSANRDGIHRAAGRRGAFSRRLCHHGHDAHRRNADLPRRCPQADHLRLYRPGHLHLPHQLALSGIDFRTAMLYRVYQSIGLAFFFVPINTICYVGVPQEQNNQVSAMINLMRNLGGSFGISFVTTMLARRSQVHQTYLAAHVTNSNSTAARAAGYELPVCHPLGLRSDRPAARLRRHLRRCAAAGLRARLRRHPAGHDRAHRAGDAPGPARPQAQARRGARRPLTERVQLPHTCRSQLDVGSCLCLCLCLCLSSAACLEVSS